MGELYYAVTMASRMAVKMVVQTAAIRERNQDGCHESVKFVGHDGWQDGRQTAAIRERIRIVVQMAACYSNRLFGWLAALRWG